MPSVFTRIVNGEIPAYKVAEDEHFLAFLDISPLTRGHTLVIPKKEVDYLFEMDDELYTGLHLFAKKVASALKKAVPCVRIGSLVLGLDVPHAHIHLVPMQSEADILNFSKTLKLSPEEFEEIRKEIASAF